MPERAEHLLHEAVALFGICGNSTEEAMYYLPASLRVENPLNRYPIYSPMLPNLNCAADGGATPCIRHESPVLTKKPTGSRHRRARSGGRCVFIGRSPRRSRAVGISRD